MQQRPEINPFYIPYRIMIMAFGGGSTITLKLPLEEGTRGY